MKPNFEYSRGDIVNISKYSQSGIVLEQVGIYQYQSPFSVKFIKAEVYIILIDNIKQVFDNNDDDYEFYKFPNNTTKPPYYTDLNIVWWNEKYK